MDRHTILVDYRSGSLLNFSFQMFALADHFNYTVQARVKLLLCFQDLALIISDSFQCLLHLAMVDLYAIERAKNFEGILAYLLAIFVKFLGDRLYNGKINHLVVHFWISFGTSVDQVDDLLSGILAILFCAIFPEIST